MFDFYYTHSRAVDSSLASYIFYNEQNSELALLTNDNGTMVYQDVPFNVYRQLTSAPSVGRAYNQLVKGQYTNKHGYTVSHVAYVFVESKEEEKVVAESKTFTVRAYVEFEAEITASTLEEAVILFKEAHSDAYEVKIKEVVVPFE